mgnify:CR=1 FL=1
MSKRLIAFLVTAIMVFQTVPVVYADTPIFEVNPNVLNESGMPYGIRTVNVPLNGNVKVTDVDGVKKLAVEDTMTTSAGPTVAVDIPSMRGNFVVNVKLTPGNAFRFDFFDARSATYTDGVRILANASGVLYAYNGTTEYCRPAALLKANVGDETEMWFNFNMVAKKCDVYVKNKSTTTYTGAVAEHCSLDDGILKIADIPVKCDSVNRIYFVATNNSGTSYIDYINVYNGEYRPSKPNDFVVPNYLSGVKAPWITRGETISAIKNNTEIDPDDKFDDTTVEKIKITDEMLVEYRPTEEQIQAGLEKYEGVHPRIMMCEEEWEEYLVNILSPEYEDKLEMLLDYKETLMAKPLYDITTDTAIADNQRGVGNTLYQLAWIYKVTGDEAVFNRLLEWIEVVLNLEKFGTDNVSIAAGHLLIGLALTYDWLYDELPEDLKSKMLEKMITHGTLLEAAGGKAWNYQPTINQGWINMAAIAATTNAIYDEYEPAKEWIDTAVNYMSKAFFLLGEDGASQEGVGYWTYGFAYMMFYIEFSRDLWGYDPCDNVEWLANTGTYRLYMSYPRNGWTQRYTAANLGDGYGYDYSDIYSMMYFLAREFGNTEYVWLADEMEARDARSTIDKLLSVAYYNADLSKNAKSPEELDLPTLHVFSQLGIVSSRSDWSGDESAIYFKCGPNIEADTVKYEFFSPLYDFGSAHAHPDNNHFLLWGNGDLLLKDDSYVFKTTESHNTMIINGKGQKGDGTVYYNNPNDTSIYDEIPYIKKSESTEDFDYFVGAGANAYKDNMGVVKYDRHMLFVKPDVLIVLDDVELLEESDIEFRFFPESEIVGDVTTGYTAKGDKNILYMESLTPDAMEFGLDKLDIFHNKAGTLRKMHNGFSAKATTDELVNVTALSWNDKDGVAKRVKCEVDGDVYKFIVNGKEYSLNHKTFTVTAKDVEVAEHLPVLGGLSVEGNPIDLQEDVYDYNVNLDDYFYNVRVKEADVYATPKYAGEDVEIKIEYPEAIPGTVKVYVSNSLGTNTYNVNITKTDFNVSRVALTPVNNYNPEGSDKFYPSVALDRNYLNFWYTSKPEHTLDYKLGEVKKICGVDIAWKESVDEFIDFEVQVSTDGENYETVFAGKEDVSTTRAEYYPFENEVEASFIRVKFNIPEGRNYMYMISEFSAYENK